MPETLTDEEIRGLRDIGDAWPQIQAALKMGTSLQSSYDGHMHREIVIQEQGSGTPGHTAKQRTLYWDNAGKKLFINDDGSTGWTEIGGGGTAGIHTLDSNAHLDIEVMNEAVGDLLIGVGGIIEKWKNLPRGTQAQYLKMGASAPAWATFATDAIAAVPYEIYLSFGSERESFTPV